MQVDIITKAVSANVTLTSGTVLELRPDGQGGIHTNLVGIGGEHLGAHDVNEFIHALQQVAASSR
jgi:hypothetical protein